MDYTDGEPEYGGVNRESQVSLKVFCAGAWQREYLLDGERFMVYNLW